MNQIRYVLTAVLLLAAGWALTSLLKPAAGVPLIAAKTEEQGFFCGTLSVELGGDLSKLDNPQYRTGKELFQQNCQACHALQKALTGPALAGFMYRGPWQKRSNIYKWIRNPKRFMRNDPYTKSLERQYGATMFGFPQLTREQVDALIFYVEAHSAPYKT